MKRLLLPLLLFACETHYTTRFDASATTVLPANLSTEPITLTEGGLVYSDARLYENDGKVDVRTESDLEVSSVALSVCRVLRGPKANSFVFMGVAPGDTNVEIRYRGHLIQTRNVHVDAQP